MGREVLKTFKLENQLISRGQENLKKTEKGEEEKETEDTGSKGKKTGKLHSASHRRVSGRNRFTRRVVFTP
jgi:hypothetical protein